MAKSAVEALEYAFDFHPGELLPKVGTVWPAERVPRIRDVVLMAIRLDDAGSGGPAGPGGGFRRVPAERDEIRGRVVPVGVDELVELSFDLTLDCRELFNGIVVLAEEAHARVLLFDGARQGQFRVVESCFEEVNVPRCREAACRVISSVPDRVSLFQLG